jgi:hypothetical protein
MKLVSFRTYYLTIIKAITKVVNFFSKKSCIFNFTFLFEFVHVYFIFFSKTVSAIFITCIYLPSLYSYIIRGHFFVWVKLENIFRKYDKILYIFTAGLAMENILNLIMLIENMFHLSLRRKNNLFYLIL